MKRLVSHLRASLKDYRSLPNGDESFGGLAYEWKDKPHRIIYDLCGEIERLRKIVRVLTADPCIHRWETRRRHGRGGRFYFCLKCKLVIDCDNEGRLL
jgi:hypothetical protein